MKKLELKENLEKFTRIEQCPIRNIVSRFSGKWSMLVLCILAEEDSLRFNAIQKAIPDISSKVLTSTLRNLETSGLIRRESYPEIPPRVEYTLTPLGHSLLPHIESLVEWAVTHFGNSTRQTAESSVL